MIKVLMSNLMTVSWYFWSHIQISYQIHWKIIERALKCTLDVLVVGKYKYLPNRKCEPSFFNPSPLQPKRNMIEAWNLACLVLGGVVFGPSRRFLIYYPWAKIWGWGGAAPGGVKKSWIFFLVFSPLFVISSSGMTKKYKINP